MGGKLRVSENPQKLGPKHHSETVGIFGGCQQFHHPASAFEASCRDFLSSTKIVFEMEKSFIGGGGVKTKKVW